MSNPFPTPRSVTDPPDLRREVLDEMRVSAEIGYPTSYDEARAIVIATGWHREDAL